MATMKMAMAVGTGNGVVPSTLIVKEDNTSWTLTTSDLGITGQIIKVSANSYKAYGAVSDLTPLAPELEISKGESDSWTDGNGVTNTVALNADGTTITVTRSSGLGGVILVVCYN